MAFDRECKTKYCHSERNWKQAHCIANALHCIICMYICAHICRCARIHSQSQTSFLHVFLHFFTLTQDTYAIHDYAKSVSFWFTMRFSRVHFVYVCEGKQPANQPTNQSNTQYRYDMSDLNSFTIHWEINQNLPLFRILRWIWWLLIESTKICVGSMIRPKNDRKSKFSFRYSIESRPLNINLGWNHKFNMDQLFLDRQIQTIICCKRTVHFISMVGEA